MARRVLIGRGRVTDSASHTTRPRLTEGERDRTRERLYCIRPITVYGGEPDLK